MSKFAEFAKLGMDAWNTAVEARREIASVFDELNKDLGTLGDIRLEVKEFHEMPGMGIVQAFFNPKQYSALAIVCTTNDSFQPRQLARWKQPHAGYPCWVITGEEEVSCEDKTSLENELGKLLSSAKGGEALSAAVAASRSAAGTQAGP
jgi:hypothetical protein